MGSCCSAKKTDVKGPDVKNESTEPKEGACRKGSVLAEGSSKDDKTDQKGKVEKKGNIKADIKDNTKTDTKDEIKGNNTKSQPTEDKLQSTTKEATANFPIRRPQPMEPEDSNLPQQTTSIDEFSTTSFTSKRLAMKNRKRQSSVHLMDNVKMSTLHNQLMKHTDVDRIEHERGPNIVERRTSRLLKGTTSNTSAMMSIAEY